MLNRNFKQIIMINIKNKKIPLSILLISFVLIIFTLILKEKRRFSVYNDFGIYTGYKVKNVIRFLDFQLSYNNTLFFLFIAVIISILALIFLDDAIIIKKTVELNRRFSSVKIYKQKISNLLKKPINRIIIGIVTLIIILLVVCNFNKPKNAVLTETNIVTVDTVALPSDIISKEKVDSTISIKASRLVKEIHIAKQNNIDTETLVDSVEYYSKRYDTEQANKKRERSPRKGTIVNAETPDIIAKQEQFNKQTEELAQFHKEAELAQQAREREFKKQEMELLVAKQKAAELLKQKEEEKLALQKKETIFYLSIIVCFILFSVLSFFIYKNNFKNKLK